MGPRGPEQADKHSLDRTAKDDFTNRRQLTSCVLTYGDWAASCYHYGGVPHCSRGAHASAGCPCAPVEIGAWAGALGVVPRERTMTRRGRGKPAPRLLRPHRNISPGSAHSAHRWVGWRRLRKPPETTLPPASEEGAVQATVCSRRVLFSTIFFVSILGALFRC